MLARSPNREERKTIFTPKNPEKNKNFAPNPANQAFLSESIYIVIDFIYHSRLFSQGFQGLMYFKKNLQDNINKSQSTLQHWKNQIDSEISASKTQLQDLEKSYDLLINNNETLSEIVNVPIFTEINSEFIQKVCLESKHVEKCTFFSKKIIFIKTHIENLEEKKKCLNEENDKEIKEILQDFMKIEKLADEIKSCEEAFKLGQNFTKIVEDERLRNMLKQQMTEIIDFAAFMEKVYKKNTHFLKTLTAIEAHPEIYSSLATAYSLYEVENIIKIIYEQDLSNLMAYETNLKSKIDDYSPTWLIKQFQKNADSLYNCCCKLVDKLNSVNIEFQFSTNNGMTNISLKNHNHALICYITLGNYKALYIKTEEQKVMNDIIKALCQDIAEIIRAIVNMRIIHLNAKDYSLEIPFITIRPKPVINLDLIQSEYRDQYAILVKYTKKIEEFTSYLISSLKQFSIYTNWGLIKEAEYRNEFDSIKNDFQKIEISPAKHGIKDANLDKPLIHKKYIDFSIQFPNHNDFKAIKSSLNDTIDKIRQTKEKLTYKECINKQIQDLHSQLTIEMVHQAAEKELSTLNKEFKCLENFKQANIRNFSIQKIFYRALFGSFVSRINFRKPKIFKRASKIHKRTRSTIIQFVDAFWKCLQTCQKVENKAFEENIELIGKVNEISIDSIVKFMVSEDIIGSFMNDEDRVQDIFNGKIMGDCEKSWFVFCSDTIEIVLSQIEKSKGCGEKTKRINEIEKELEKVNQYQSGFYKNFQRYFL